MIVSRAMRTALALLALLASSVAAAAGPLDKLGGFADVVGHC